MQRLMFIALSRLWDFQEIKKGTESVRAGYGRYGLALLEAPALKKKNKRMISNVAQIYTWLKEGDNVLLPLPCSASCKNRICCFAEPTLNYMWFHFTHAQHELPYKHFCSRLATALHVRARSLLMHDAEAGLCFAFAKLKRGSVEQRARISLHAFKESLLANVTALPSPSWCLYSFPCQYDMNSRIAKCYMAGSPSVTGVI
ncbi:hypothetical protein L7F22_029973 [Adiantum nelumboides]|nr:hypothetical protein [Adiantum nelumboides]